MRSIFNKTLIKIAEKDPRIHMVLADIGYGEIEGFARKFPDRYYNCGVILYMKLRFLTLLQRTRPMVG